MDFSEMNLIVEGHLKSEDKELDKLRTLGYWFLSPYSKNLKPSDLIKIPSIDNKSNINKPVNKEEMIKKAERIKQDINNKKWVNINPNKIINK